MKSSPAKVIIRTRMAPSPTGLLHIGTARTTLFNFLFARHHGGAFILRVEDTDKERSQREYEENIIVGLHWLGIQWDEGPTVVATSNQLPATSTYIGDYGPYRQSERTEIYKKYLEQLLIEGKAFYCIHSKEFLEAELKAQMDLREAPRHVCEDRGKGHTEGIIRLKNEATGAISFTDLIRGSISVPAESLGDFSIARDPLHVLYNFAVVVDDYTMHISHVIRGEEHIANTPRQILIQEALGFPRPVYAHLPLILNKDRSKMSKRGDSTSIDEYRKEGYLPEAIVNFIALLGWHPTDEQEIMDMDRLIREFDLKRVQKSGAAFDPEKLRWMNGEWIRMLPIPQLTARVMPFLEEAGLLTVSGGTYHAPGGEAISPLYLEGVVALEQPRLKTVREVTQRTGFFFEVPIYDADLLRWKGEQPPEETTRNLEKIHKILCDINEDLFNEEHLRVKLTPIAEKLGKGEVLWPLRAALSGREASPDPFQLLSVLGKKRSLQRLAYALTKLAERR